MLTTDKEEGNQKTKTAIIRDKHRKNKEQGKRKRDETEERKGKVSVEMN